MTIFPSTHILGIAEEICQRIGIPHGKQIMALEAMEELRRQARSADDRLEPLFFDVD